MRRTAGRIWRWIEICIDIVYTSLHNPQIERAAHEGVMASTLKKARPVSAAAYKSRNVATAPRGATINLRVTDQMLNLIDSAAAVAGKSRSAFMLESAQQHAIDVLLDQKIFLLNDEQHDAFMHALSAPPQSLAGLKKLMAKKAPWQS
jgi:uncharacterized protein (DUF1778 family)